MASKPKDDLVRDFSCRFRVPYGPHYRVFTHFVGDSLTKQSFKDECDINVIMARYMRNGTLDFINQREAQFADVSEMDYQEAQFLVSGARSMFMELPSELRTRFNNNPGALLGFLQDERNYDEAVSLGLVKPKVAAAAGAAAGTAGGDGPAVAAPVVTPSGASKA